MRGSIFTVFATFLALRTNGQEIDCSKFYPIIRSLHEGTIVVFENAPSPIVGFDELRKNLHIRYATDSGKVYVEFIVDTVGRARCAKVVKTDNDSLNGLAIALIEKTKFTPADQQGRRMACTMVLPVVFGPGPPKEGKKSKKKRRNSWKP